MNPAMNGSDQGIEGVRSSWDTIIVASRTPCRTQAWTVFARPSTPGKSHLRFVILTRSGGLLLEGAPSARAKKIILSLHHMDLPLIRGRQT
jgi:hypothetical protein